MRAAASGSTRSTSRPAHPGRIRCRRISIGVLHRSAGGGSCGRHDDRTGIRSGVHRRTAVLGGAAPALIAGLGYAIYTVAGAHMITAGVSTQGAMGQMFGIGGILLLPILIWQWPGGLDTGAGATAVVYLVVVPTVLAYLLFAAALRHLEPGPSQR